MKTANEQSRTDSTEQLFRQLFEAQYKFELNADHSDPQVSVIISAIDELLEKIIEYSDE